ncbi:hypothetical protein H6G91_29760 [Nostoc muscorum FACHB-395]|nr:hypothetical protein [Desmonostoc muscorum FACHB-395]
MDAFYASVEQRDNPSYRGKPLVVGGSPNQRGVVAAASYEARKFGIHSAMPSITAIARCPGLIFVRPRFDVYRNISTSIHAIFKRYSDLVEGVALDEAYLDVTENKQNITYASKCANVSDRLARSKAITTLHSLRLPGWGDGTALEGRMGTNGLHTFG